jgi:hypothetical protein
VESGCGITDPETYQAQFRKRSSNDIHIPVFN